jgi:hypothetical protein
MTDDDLDQWLERCKQRRESRVDLSKRGLTLPSFSLIDFNYMTILYINNNNLTSLPILPNWLLELDCNYNKLTSLNNLPLSLTHLKCAYNELTILPDILPSLKVFDCSHNKLTVIKYLPSTLRNFSCKQNYLTELPVLPESLEHLICNLQLQDISDEKRLVKVELPWGLKTLDQCDAEPYKLEQYRQRCIELGLPVRYSMAMPTKEEWYKTKPT